MSQIEVESEGKIYRADYVLSENVVTVFGEGGTSSTQLGGVSERTIAKMLLRNLIREGKVQPE
ncbi:hypothetical protein [Chitinimonas sp. JJ19]|uniref:hypothetical protein n=1 Tax=Chitinimonas sp. JJ19 TaxID=3109352 RepID=UPI003002C4CA